jgi:hypothetical protein
VAEADAVELAQDAQSFAFSTVTIKGYVAHVEIVIGAIIPASMAGAASPTPYGETPVTGYNATETLRRWSQPRFA